MASSINVKVKPKDISTLLTIAEKFGYKCFDDRSVEQYTNDFKKNPWLAIEFRGKDKEWQGCDGLYDYFWESNTLEVIKWLENKVDNSYKLNDNHTAIFETDGIHVGCQTFSYATIETLYKKSIEFKKFYNL